MCMKTALWSCMVSAPKLNLFMLLKAPIAKIGGCFDQCVCQLHYMTVTCLRILGICRT